MSPLKTIAAGVVLVLVVRFLGERIGAPIRAELARWNWPVLGGVLLALIIGGTVGAFFGLCIVAAFAS